MTSITAAASVASHSDEPPLLRLKDVSVVRGTASGAVRILDRLTLSIPQGQHTVIVGPNGSGKTSLLKLLSRQFYPSVDDGQTGTVEILGQSAWHIDELRKRMGIVSGELDREFSLTRSGRMTALQAVLSGFDGVRLITFIDQTDRSRIDRAETALESVGAGHLTDRTLMTMSTGERRRVLIARALVHQPQAIVLDEPTTGLDIASSSSFLKAITNLARSGITIILVTHHVEEIIPEIRHAILLKSGRLFAGGPCDETLTAETLGGLFGVPVAVRRTDAARYSLETTGG